MLLKTIVAAMGQLFYSMSLAMGIMVTYGSYMRKQDSIETSVRQISVFDTGIAIIAGCAVLILGFTAFFIAKTGHLLTVADAAADHRLLCFRIIVSGSGF